MESVRATRKRGPGRGPALEEVRVAVPTDEQARIRVLSRPERRAHR